ncbi:MAG: glycosyltransferase [Planctomycetaceae bacterium]|jgi:glycosyltransferase involved in cell wall biosynthesis|nr:glycosyltransferase [Planctomycetaceae bacterium]
MNTEINISVIIATYNRSVFLRQTLETLIRQDFPKGTWEILVINNQSTDDTESVLQEFSARDSRIRSVYEEKIGTSLARNRGILESRGQITVHLDDDVILEPSWLKTLVAPIQNDLRQRIGVLGGRTINYFPDKEVNQWASPFRESRPYSDHLCQLHNSPFPIGGGNMAVPRWVYDQIGMFNTNLGPVGNIMLFAEDTEFIDRAYNAGLEIWYNGEASLLHQIPASRLTFSAIFNHRYNYGRSSVIRKTMKMRENGQTIIWKLLQKIIFYSLSLLVFLLGALGTIIIFRRDIFKRFLVRAGGSLGYIRQSLYYLLGGK